MHSMCLRSVLGLVAMTYCDAPRNKQQKCRRPSGWGTNHPGTGQCRNHDKVPAAVSDALLPNTRTIKQLANEFRSDRDPFDLREEIALTRSAIALLVEDVEAMGDLIGYAKPINMLLNTLGKLIQRLHEIEVGRKYVISVDQVQRSLRQITVIVCEAIPDPAVRAEVAQRINQLSLGPSDSASTPSTSLTDAEAQVVSLVRVGDSIGDSS
jgi:hypothetical protein